MTGYAGTTQQASAGSDIVLDDTIKVRFDGSICAGMAWEFAPARTTKQLRIGETGLAFYRAHNPTNRTIVGQAVPSLVPQSAASHFHKTECFCFERQTLGPGESMKMPMRFIVGPELPKNVQSISLSYALFDVTELAGGAAVSDSDQRI